MAKVTDIQKIQQGSTDIELTTPIKIEGVDVKVLRMREPTVNDQMTHDAMTGSEGEKEVATFANLCVQAPEDIRKLTLRDYRKLQRAYNLFLV